MLEAMKKYSFTTQDVCAKQIDLELNKDDTIKKVDFQGGCPGNLLGISKLIPGMKAQEVINLFEGNVCGARGTSCPDQLAKALKEMRA